MLRAEFGFFIADTSNWYIVWPALIVLSCTSILVGDTLLQIGSELKLISPLHVGLAGKITPID